MLLSRRTALRAPPVVACVIALVTVGLDTLVTDVVAAPATGTTELLSVGTDGSRSVPARGDSGQPSLAANGRFVAFTSTATNLVRNQVGGGSSFNVFRYDRTTGETVLVSSAFSAAGPTTPTQAADGDSTEPSISADGRYVAFTSTATNLLAETNDKMQDVFVRDLDTGTTTLMSPRVVPFGKYQSAGTCQYPVPRVRGGSGTRRWPRLGGQPVRSQVATRDCFVGGGHSPAISGDGRWVAFVEGTPSNVVTVERTRPNQPVEISAARTAPKDCSDGATSSSTSTTTTTVSPGLPGSLTLIRCSSDTPAISADGRFIAFQSEAADLVYGDGNGSGDIFVWAREGGGITRVSVDNTNGELRTSSREPSISGDGRRVAFVTDAAIDPDDANGNPDVYVRGRGGTGFGLPSTRRISVTAAGGDHNGSDVYLAPAMSADGGWVAWQSRATNVVPGQTPRCVSGGRASACQEVFAREVEGSTTERVSESSTGEESNGDSYRPSISGNGQVVAFHSIAGNLVPADTNGARDVFARDRRPTLSVTPNPGEFPAVRTGEPSTRIFTAENTGVGTLRISAVTVGGTAGADYTLVDDGCANRSLPSRATCRVTVRFRPVAASARPAELVFTHDALNSPYAVPLSGTGTAPEFAVTPNPGQFDARPVGTTRRLGFLATNTGSAPLAVSNVVIEGPHAADFTVSGSADCTAAPIAPSGTCAVDVDFEPSAAGARTAELVFTDDAPGSPHRVPLRGTGTVPGLEITPDPGEFGGTPVGTTASLTFTARNTGVAPLVVSKVAVDGPGADDFAITSGGDSCSGKTAIASGQSCTVEVNFTPSADTARTAELVFTDNAPGSPHKVAVKGAGIMPRIAVTPDPADFGSRVTGTATKQTFTLRSVGTAPLAISSIAVAGSDAAVFVLGDSSGCRRAPLPPEGFCTVDVTFTPSTTGPRAARLSVTDNGPGSPHAVPLTGAGAAPPKDPAIMITPDPGDYGVQTVGGPTTMAFTAQSLGDKDLKIATVAVEGTDRSDFAIVAEADSCTGATLPRGALCTVMVTFTPSQTGSRSARLVFSDNAPRSPHRVALAGRGLAALGQPPPDPGAPAPVLTVDPAVAPTGSVVAVRGSGFMPNAPVRLHWLSGVGAASVTTDTSGTFETAMLILHHDVVGWRQLEASDGRGTARANALIVLPEIQPRRFVQRG